MQYFHLYFVVNYEARRAHSLEKKIGAILRNKGDEAQEDVSLFLLFYIRGIGIVCNGIGIFHYKCIEQML